MGYFMTSTLPDIP